MRRVRIVAAILWLSLAGIVDLPGMPVHGEDPIYEGQWNTTNRKLDGQMTCVVTEQGTEKWSGRFYGVWQGVPFDYTVPFAGPPKKLRGTAIIDGASYEWTGTITEGPAGLFKAAFGGNRYLGSFELKPKTNATAARPPRTSQER